MRVVLDLLHTMAAAANESSGVHDIWHLTDPSRFSPIRMATPRRLPSRDGGLAGGVMATGKPVRITDLTKEPPFGRQRAAATADLISGFGFPVLVGTRLVAVIELFSCERRQPDQLLMDTAADGAAQLGHLVERSHAREALAHQALYDTLTRLPNRRLFLDRLDRAVAEPSGRAPIWR